MQHRFHVFEVESVSRFPRFGTCGARARLSRRSSGMYPSSLRILRHARGCVCRMPGDYRRLAFHKARILRVPRMGHGGTFFAAMAILPEKWSTSSATPSVPNRPRPARSVPDGRKAFSTSTGTPSSPRCRMVKTRRPLNRASSMASRSHSSRRGMKAAALQDHESVSRTSQDKASFISKWI